jgi:hypothetical protein
VGFLRKRPAPVLNASGEDIVFCFSPDVLLSKGQKAKLCKHSPARKHKQETAFFFSKLRFLNQLFKEGLKFALKSAEKNERK